MADIAASNAVRRNTRLLRENPRSELFRRHFEREKTNPPSILGDGTAVGSACCLIGFRGVERDVGSESRLSHRRSSGQNHEVGRVQPAELLIEIEESGCYADSLATALESRFGVANGVCQCGPKGAKPALQLAHGGEVEEPLLRTLDLLAGRIVEILAEGVVDHILAKCDQLASLVEIIDNSTVVFGVDDRHRACSKSRQVLRSADRG